VDEELDLPCAEAPPESPCLCGSSAELQVEESLNGPLPGGRYAVPAPGGCLGREEREKELGYFQIQKLPSRGELPALPWGLAVPVAAFNPAP